jgi:hypothetical protein
MSPQHRRLGVMYIRLAVTCIMAMSPTVSSKETAVKFKKIKNTIPKRLNRSDVHHGHCAYIYIYA